MNSVQLVGRFTRDPEVRYANSGISIAKFSLAVDRAIKTEGGQDADFISCTAFGKTAEFVEKYFRKGQRIGLTGRIQTGSYINNDGIRVYTTDVIADRVEFVESRREQGTNEYARDDARDGFMNIPDGIDEELPFN